MQPRVAYEHLLQHGKKIRDQLREPEGYDALPGSTASATTRTSGATTTETEVAEIAALMQSNPSEVLRRLTTDVDLVNRIGPAVARVMVAAAEGHRRAQTAETKAADMLTSEQFAKDLRACMRVFVEHQEQHGARRLAARIVAVLREQLSVDLTAHAGAQSVLSYTILEDLNVGIAELRQAIDDAIAAKGG